ncbi:unnamed protein product [Oncorhynchus mykiss]|uniref:BRISC and BRCA1-A complex member 2 n=1 Tax=Oncorhynchus mykiss TaxID=8022 RepID=A0A060WZI5_ONCMY|nr:unnamed protein product [Oncorhynchus mykiss]
MSCNKMQINYLIIIQCDLLDFCFRFCLSQGVVEYDAEGFTKLTLLLMWKDFCFLVHVDLPLYFPRDQPTLTFQSVYHFTNSGQLYSQVQKSYPYSPRWDGNEMAKRAKAYFKSFIPQFQEGAFATGKL